MRLPADGSVRGLRSLGVPPDAGLSALLRSVADGPARDDIPDLGAYWVRTQLAAMANAAFPGHRHTAQDGTGHVTGAGTGNVHVRVPDHVHVLGVVLAAVERQARADGNPAADLLAGVLDRSFGITVQVPETPAA